MTFVVFQTFCIHQILVVWEKTGLLQQPLDNATVNFIRTLGISPVAELRTLVKNSLEFENSGSASHSHSCTISARVFRLQLPSR
jgi:hypothetical protein